MLRTSRTLVPAAAAVLLVGGLVGCGDDGGSTTASPQASTSTSGSDAPVITRSPLDVYLFGDMDDQFAEDRKIEEATQACMEAQGFTYKLAPEVEDDGEDSDVIVLPTREWVAEHGSGEIDRALESAKMADDPAANDPNGAYVQSLTPEQHAAYERALYGPTGAIGDEAGASWEDMGCGGKASHEIAPGREEPRPPIIAEALAFQDTVRADPKVAAVYAEVDTCMTEAGYPPPEIMPAEPPVQEGPSTGDDTHDILSYVETHPSATLDDPVVKKFLKDDIARALAQWDCEDETDVWARSAKITADLESAFVDEHKKELEEAQVWISGQ